MDVNNSAGEDSEEVRNMVEKTLWALCFTLGFENLYHIILYINRITVLLRRNIGS